MADKYNKALPCGVVKDLLPLYVEGLVNEETAALVEAHLAACEACHAACDAMREGASPEEALARLEQERQQNLAEAQYLKRIKSKHRRTVWLSVVAVALVVMLGAYIFNGHQFSIPLNRVEVREVYMLEENRLLVKLYAGPGAMPVGGIAFGGYYIDDDGNQVHEEYPGVGFEYRIGQTLATRIKNRDKDGYFFLTVKLDDIGAFYLGGWNGGNRLLLWQQGDETLDAPQEVVDMVRDNGGGGVGLWTSR